MDCWRYWHHENGETSHGLRLDGHWRTQITEDALSSDLPGTSLYTMSMNLKSVLTVSIINITPTSPSRRLSVSPTCDLLISQSVIEQNTDPARVDRSEPYCMMGVKTDQLGKGYGES